MTSPIMAARTVIRPRAEPFRPLVPATIPMAIPIPVPRQIVLNRPMQAE
jgi:hypothetical protein